MFNLCLIGKEQLQVLTVPNIMGGHAARILNAHLTRFGWLSIREDGAIFIMFDDREIATRGNILTKSNTGSISTIKSNSVK